jgi:ABC-2 type transport system ATP-binding protein
MPDYFGTYQNMNVVEYLDFFARAYGLHSTQRRAAIDYAMEFTLLDQLADKPINGLSKGMKQRLSLGRTMIHDPAVLILDEPAAVLDPRARIELREMINRLAENGKTVLISSHILTELAEMCHRVGIIERGHLLAVGTVEEISARTHTRSEVRLRVLRDADGLMNYLRSREDVSDVAVRQGQVSLTHEGGPEEQAALLKQLVQMGFAIVEFASKTKSLEDVFMQVTGGLVQ